jgi:very-short-patch-repair endonuclease
MSRRSIPFEFRHSPFTTASAKAAGMSRTVLAGKQFRQVLRGVWVHCDVPDSRALRLAAVRLILGPDAFICGPTAAWVYGMDVQDPRNELLWIGYRGDRRPRTRAGCRIQRVSLADDELRIVEGVAMTTPPRTAFDCARWLPLVEGVVVADALAHERLIDLTALAALVADRRGLRGIATADRVVELADERSESPMETRVRVLLIEGGLPTPEPQVVIEDENGDFVARADLGYRLEKLAVEYDGAWHFGQRARDERRRQAMRDLGWTVIVLTSDDYYLWPKATVARVGAKLAALGRPS